MRIQVVAETAAFLFECLRPLSDMFKVARGEKALQQKKIGQLDLTPWITLALERLKWSVAAGYRSAAITISIFDKFYLPCFANEE